MLINKLLADNNYIFVKNSNLQYLKTLSNLGSIPIFVYIKDNERIICKELLLMTNMISYDIEFCIYKKNYHLFNLDCCSISEIKQVLNNTIIYNIDETQYFALPFYVQDIYLLF